MTESFDGGIFWEPSIRITDASTDARLMVLTPGGRILGDYMGLAPAIGCDSPAVPIWIDTLSGSPDPFVVRVDRTQGTRFEVWRGLPFGDDGLEDEEISGEGEDPDDDGIPNLLEYFFAADPLEPGA